MSFTVVILGRPNVGKSTLFNRLIGQRSAIVHKTPGASRDRRSHKASLAGMEFILVDTAGLEHATEASLEQRMLSQTYEALRLADVALFLIDARAGVTPFDADFANILRRQATPVILCANKCEGAAGEHGRVDAYRLGLGDPLPLSAQHGDGLADLFHALSPYAQHESGESAADDTSGQAAAERPLRLVIVGHPNTGKSTLVNNLLGENRVLTGPEAGLTRDVVEIDWTCSGRRIQLVDTAGLRRKSKIDDPLEKLSVSRTIDAIRKAEVVALLCDATEALNKQTLTIARFAADEGRALVLGANKWDVVTDPGAVLQRLGNRLSVSLPQFKGASVVTLSALRGDGIDQLLTACFAAHRLWSTRVATGALNRWLAHMVQAHPPPLVGRGVRVRLRYITQAATRPPTFALFASHPNDLPESYRRYLVNGIREDYGIIGVPIRMVVRKSGEPRAARS